MEEKYFIIINGVQKGPYSIQELNTQNITLDTLVWKKGMDCWLKIADMPELVSALKDILPPPMPGTNVNIQTNKPIQIELSKRKSENNFIADTSKNFWKWLKKLIAGECVFLFKEFCCIVVLGIVLFSFFYVYTYPPYLSDKEQEEIRLELSRREPICEELLEKYKESLDNQEWRNDWNYIKAKFKYENKIIEEELRIKGYEIKLETKESYSKIHREIIHNDLIQKYDILIKTRKWEDITQHITQILHSYHLWWTSFDERDLSNYNKNLEKCHKGIIEDLLSKNFPLWGILLFIGIYILRVITLITGSFVKWVRKNK